MGIYTHFGFEGAHMCAFFFIRPMPDMHSETLIGEDPGPTTGDLTLHPLLYYGLLIEDAMMFLDREELKLRRIKSGTGPAMTRMLASSERYLRVPAVPHESLLSHAAPFLSRHLTADQADLVRQAGRGWMNHARELLSPEAFQELGSTIYRMLVVSAERWLDSVGVPREPFVRPRKHQPPPAAEDDSTPTKPPPVSARPPEGHLVFRDPRHLQAFIRQSEREAAFLDLDSMQILWIERREDSWGPPVSEAPYQYIKIATIPTEEQLAFVLETLGSRLSPTDRDKLGAAGRAWSAELKPILTDREWNGFTVARVDWVAHRAKSFFEDHRIEPSLFVLPARWPRTPPQAAPPTSMEPVENRGLRAWLHDAIDAMSPAELAALQIPAHIAFSLGVRPSRYPSRGD